MNAEISRQNVMSTGQNISSTCSLVKKEKSNQASCSGSHYPGGPQSGPAHTDFVFFHIWQIQLGSDPKDVLERPKLRDTV